MIDFGGRTRIRTLDPLIKSWMGKHFIRAEIRSNQLLRRKSASYHSSCYADLSREIGSFLVISMQGHKFSYCIDTDSPHLHMFAMSALPPKADIPGTAIPRCSFRYDPTALQARASKLQGHSRHVQFSDRAGEHFSGSQSSRERQEPPLVAQYLLAS